MEDSFLEKIYDTSSNLERKISDLVHLNSKQVKKMFDRGLKELVKDPKRFKNNFNASKDLMLKQDLFIRVAATLQINEWVDWNSEESVHNLTIDAWCIFSKYFEKKSNRKKKKFENLLFSFDFYTNNCIGHRVAQTVRRYSNEQFSLFNIIKNKVNIEPTLPFKFIRDEMRQYDRQTYEEVKIILIPNPHQENSVTRSGLPSDTLSDSNLVENSLPFYWDYQEINSLDRIELKQDERFVYSNWQQDYWFDRNFPFDSLSPDLEIENILNDNSFSKDDLKEKDVRFEFPDSNQSSNC
jgi:hypothetical protein